MITSSLSLSLHSINLTHCLQKPDIMIIAANLKARYWQSSHVPRLSRLTSIRASMKMSSSPPCSTRLGLRWQISLLCSFSFVMEHNITTPKMKKQVQIRGVGQSNRAKVSSAFGKITISVWPGGPWDSPWHAPWFSCFLPGLKLLKIIVLFWKVLQIIAILSFQWN